MFEGANYPTVFLPSLNCSHHPKWQQLLVLEAVQFL